MIRRILARGILFASMGVWLGLLFPAGATEPPSGDRPEIPGIEVVANIGHVCPREAPLHVDCNADGTDDFVCPCYHIGAFHDYPSGYHTSIGGIFGVTKTLKGQFKNANFKHAGVIDGKTSELLWSFQAGALIDQAAVSRDGKYLFAGAHDDRLYALELASGDTVWTKDLGANTFALSVSREELVVTTKDKVLALKPADGSSLWERPIKAAVMPKDFGRMLNDADTVYVSSLDNKVYALDRHSGQERWVFESQGNPSLMALTRGVLLISDKKSVIGLDTTTGTAQWQFDSAVKGSTTWPSPQIVPVAEADGTSVFLGCSLKKASRLFALDTEDGSLRWSMLLESAVRPPARYVEPADMQVLKRWLIVGRDHDGTPETLYVMRPTLQAIRVADGEVLWSAAPSQKKWQWYRVALAGDRIVAVEGKNVVRCFRAGDGEQLWEQQVGHTVVKMEQLADTLLIALGSKELLALSMKDGTVQSRFALGEPYRLVRDGASRLILCSRSGSWILVPA